jgi:iron complex outermembrane receptor protein
MLLTAMAALSQLVPTPVFAQAPANASTGTVQGRVLNAANGMYLSNARVTVEGTNIETFTNQFGDYVLNNVPSGPAKIVAAYTGQEPQTIQVTVVAGSSATQNISFNASQSTTSEDGTLVLNEFVVAADRYKNAQELAINEERASVNIKNVVATDAFGDIPSGNVGEFLKFVPGVLVSYGAYGGSNEGVSESDATGISVRGFGPADTAIMIDGMPVSNAFPGTLTRQVGLDMLSINNASRIEITKVPTPDMPANSIGGQVNLVTKSAFEYAKPTFNWDVYLTANEDHLDFKKTPGPTNKSTYKMSPSGTISYVMPVNQNFGATLTTSYVREFDANHRAQMTWSNPAPTPALNNTTSTAEEAFERHRIAQSNPWLSRFQVTDTPRFTERVSGNLKLDWRPFPGHHISANYQLSTYNSEEAQRSLDFRPTGDSTTMALSGQPVSWGPTFVEGQAGTNQPRIGMKALTRDKIGTTNSGTIQYKLRSGGWSIDAGASISISEGELKDRQNGHFSEVEAITGASSTPANQLKINFSGISDGVPSDIKVFLGGGSGPEFDYTQLAGWRFNSLAAKSGEVSSKDTTGVYKIDVRRELDFLPGAAHYSLAIKVGARRDEKENKKWGLGTGYAETLNPAKTLSLSDIIDDNYVGQSPGYNQKPQQWISTYKLYQLAQADPDLFGVFSDGQAVANYNSYANQQKSITETRDAFYAQIEGKFLNNRLNIVAGGRKEHEERKGKGPFTDNSWNFIKNPDGTRYTEAGTYANGVAFNNGTSGLFTDAALRGRIDALGLWYPKNPDGTPRVLTNATVEGRSMQLVTNKEVNQKRWNDPSYSISGAYEITKSLVGKLSWSRTFGQIPFESGRDGLLSGNNQYTFTEYTSVQSDGVWGQIQVANPDLEPWTSNNWDAALSYYTKSGGKITASYFWKQVENFQINYDFYSNMPAFNALLTALGLDPASYQDYRLRTTTNGDGTQKTSGWEVEWQQDLSFLGGWGKHFAAFASYTHNDLKDPVAPKPFSFVDLNGNTVTVTPANTSVIKREANQFAGAGLMFSRNRITASIRGTYKNDNERTLSSINFGPADNRTLIDVIRTYDPAETRIDVSLSYQVNKWFSVYATGRDVFNNSRNVMRRDDQGWIPAYSEYTDRRDFGIEVTFGVRGTF